MADLFDSGAHTYRAWAKQLPAPNGKIFYNKWLGKFDPTMSSEEANRRLDHVGKITQHGQDQFKRGWEHAQKTKL